MQHLLTSTLLLLRRPHPYSSGQSIEMELQKLSFLPQTNTVISVQFQHHSSNISPTNNYNQHRKSVCVFWYLSRSIDTFCHQASAEEIQSWPPVFIQLSSNIQPPVHFQTLIIERPVKAPHRTLAHELSFQLAPVCLYKRLYFQYTINKMPTDW